MRLSLALIVSCLGHIPFAIGDTCHPSISPISLPLTNITLHDGVAANRGLYLLAGSQPLGLRATTLFNNTRCRNVRDCQLGNATANSNCDGSSGSSFDISASKSWTPAAPGTWNVAIIDLHDGQETVADGDEVVTLGSIPPLPAIPSFPLEIWSNARSGNRSGLALGPSSSFLRQLLLANAVPSTVFGLFFGSRSQLQPVDGNLTIGGYDRARVAGPWTNFSISKAPLGNICPLQVSIKNIQLANSRGSFSLFADSKTTLAACIDPVQNSFSFTQYINERFANLTNHPESIASETFSQQIYPLSADSLLGNLTITLANGYETTIPHHEIVSQERGTDAEGKYMVVNASRLMSAVGSDVSAAGAVPLLGGVFLSQNYLLVDYANDMFSLAPSVQGALPPDAHRIVPVCSGEMGQVAAPEGRQNIAATVGGVGGGIVALGVLVALAYFVSRRRRIRRRNAEAREENDLPESTLRAVEPGVGPVEVLRVREVRVASEVSALSPTELEGPEQGPERTELEVVGE
ncbi:MAG: hypothetical protein M1829_004522 [Trizodia sp. TS-e1964]|nr:MAG: hypothetical protein M1829_004522 [Trizodia sp. TS-e1964]